jgi:hypothetical protein
MKKKFVLIFASFFAFVTLNSADYNSSFYTGTSLSKENESFPLSAPNEYIPGGYQLLFPTSKTPSEYNNRSYPFNVPAGFNTDPGGYNTNYPNTGIHAGYNVSYPASGVPGRYNVNYPFRGNYTYAGFPGHYDTSYPNVYNYYPKN